MRMPLDEFVKTDGNREAFERIANITQPHDKPEKIFLVGPKESGKTTLVLALLGLLAPAEGAIEIEPGPVVSGSVSPSRFSVRVARSTSTLLKAIVLSSAVGAPGTSVVRRRKTAWMRATSSRGLNGLGR